MSGLLLFGRTLLALALVLGLVYGLARLARRGQLRGPRRLPGRPSGVTIGILAKRSLSRTSAIALVEVGRRHLLIGTTAQSITLISEISADELDHESDEGTTASHDAPWMVTSGQSPTAWDALISKLREKTVRP